MLYVFPLMHFYSVVSYEYIVIFSSFWSCLCQYAGHLKQVRTMGSKLTSSRWLFSTVHTAVYQPSPWDPHWPPPNAPSPVPPYYPRAGTVSIFNIIAVASAIGAWVWVAVTLSCEEGKINHAGSLFGHNKYIWVMYDCAYGFLMCDIDLRSHQAYSWQLGQLDSWMPGVYSIVNHVSVHASAWSRPSLSLGPSHLHHRIACGMQRAKTLVLVLILIIKTSFNVQRVLLINIIFNISAHVDMCDMIRPPIVTIHSVIGVIAIFFLARAIVLCAQTRSPSLSSARRQQQPSGLILKNCIHTSCSPWRHTLA